MISVSYKVFPGKYRVFVGVLGGVPRVMWSVSRLEGIISRVIESVSGVHIKKIIIIFKVVRLLKTKPSLVTPNNFVVNKIKLCN